MNQNYEAGSEIFFEPPVKKDAKYYRRFARERLKGKAWPMVWLILIALVGLIGGILLLAFGMEQVQYHVRTQMIDVLTWVVATLLIGAYLSFVFVPVLICVRRAIVQALDGERVCLSALFRSLRCCNKADYGVGAIVSLVMAIAGLLMWIGIGFFGAFAWMGNAIHLVIAFLLPLLGVMLLSWFSLRADMVYVIRADYPELSAWDSFRNSFALTKKSNRKQIAAASSAFGWWCVPALLITVLTFGVGVIAFLFVLVHDEAAQTALYYELSQHNKADEVDFPSLDPNDYDPNEAQW